MRVFISRHGRHFRLVRWADVSTTGIDYPRGRRFLTADVNAAIAGAFSRRHGRDRGGNHGVEDLCNVLMDEIDPRCSVIRGAGRPSSTTMSGLDASCGVVLLHRPPCAFRFQTRRDGPHRVLRRIRTRVLCHGRSVGEPDLFIRAGELEVPIGMVTDQMVAEQVRANCAAGRTRDREDALSNVAANCIPPARAVQLIQAGARRAVARARDAELAPYTAEVAPHDIEVTMRKPIIGTLAANLEKLPEFKVTGGAHRCAPLRRI